MSKDKARDEVEVVWELHMHGILGGEDSHRFHVICTGKESGRFEVALHGRDMDAAENDPNSDWEDQIVLTREQAWKLHDFFGAWLGSLPP